MNINRILLLCEGKNEKEILDILLDQDLLKISRDNLIDARVFPIPFNISHPTIVSSIKANAADIDIYRVKDPQQDKIKIHKDIKKYVDNKRIYDYVTHPSIEMLLIINEGLEKEFQKAKRKDKNIDAKAFAKANITYNGIKYTGQSEFYKMYYGGPQNYGKLSNNLKEYKRISNNNKNELYLADLLKK